MRDKRKLLSEKQAAKIINVSETVFNYYARADRGPEAAFTGPDGRRYYEEAAVRAWRIPPRKNAKKVITGDQP